MDCNRCSPRPRRLDKVTFEEVEKEGEERLRRKKKSSQTSQRQQIDNNEFMRSVLKTLLPKEEARANGFCHVKVFGARRRVLVDGGHDEDQQQEAAAGRLDKVTFELQIKNPGLWERGTFEL